MGALDMGLKEDELPQLIDDWRSANPHIVQFWWDVEKAATDTVKDHQEREVGRVGFQYSAGTLWLVLPSGRKLAYPAPKMRPNRFGRMAVTYMGLNAANKWDRVETYSGKLVENCIAKGTLVVTDHGVIPIEAISSKMLIWDGEEFVHHDGLICQGERRTISVNGIHMTPEHRILTEGGWEKSVKTDGLNWAAVSLPDGSGTGGEWLASRITVQDTGCKELVYDMRNCGSRHRFAVWDKEAGCARIVSNCTQATARDLLAEAMWRMEKAGLDIVAHVHDEVILEVPKGSITVDQVCAIMNENPSWAEGLPLASAGYSGDYYFKD